MKVLVIGSGGREHALVWKLSQSARIGQIHCAPGNGGISKLAECVPIPADSLSNLAGFAEQNRIDLTVVGPEVPLSLGLTDMFEERGLSVFGPSAAAAQLESSKIFAKQFMERHDIPTAPFRVCEQIEQARKCIDSERFGFPVVLKADGLAAGKGVIIAQDKQAAHEAAELIMVQRAFGGAGDRLLIEKFLRGTEVSFMVIADGERFLPLVPSCDYKKAFEGDEGPNTGGMGAYAPAASVDTQLYRRILLEIVGPTIKGMSDEGRQFKGVLYCGLILTADGPRVLEFNVRFGDPEAQVVLPLLSGDLLELLVAAAEGAIEGVAAGPAAGAAVTVVIAAQGYPGSYEKGMAIRGADAAAAVQGVTVFHAGTRLDGERLVTSGGRVLNVTAVAEDLPKAIEQAYRGAGLVDFEGSRYRSDIAADAQA